MGHELRDGVLGFRLTEEFTLIALSRCNRRGRSTSGCHTGEKKKLDEPLSTTGVALVTAPKVNVHPRMLAKRPYKLL
jgi:hypothetical protein